ncbi:hypothetical protein [Synechococcus sp. ROS8604]|uniref:hypothetical protein n=1 Tax=Synechococcus sp. ROS8604 TaxID=1442557 RepID=UPI00164622A5|nr:hypothetical protein [Synechococcus sp. ROS8604]QNI87496.1 hypothetical protein SynROS8604_00849 [Synechococcus sp. ROS8604]
MTTLNPAQITGNEEENERNKLNENCNKSSQSLKKISILISKEMHKAIKLHTIKSDISIKDYVTQLILAKFEEEGYNLEE